ncbi:MAG TPA: hypothetical protein GXZ27_09220 [Thermoanaerobacterales bacterium]|nr:hypothetical protein [Thermoanaerobacterales bacterium]
MTKTGGFHNNDMNPKSFRGFPGTSDLTFRITDLSLGRSAVIFTGVAYDTGIND